MKDATDAQWRTGKDYDDWLAWMKKYNPDGNVADNNTIYGYSVAQTMVQVLKQCGDNLTRENVMKQAASLKDLKLPMLLPRYHRIDQRRRLRADQTDAAGEIRRHHMETVRAT